MKHVVAINKLLISDLDVCQTNPTKQLIAIDGYLQREREKERGREREREMNNKERTNKN